MANLKRVSRRLVSLATVGAITLAACSNADEATPRATPDEASPAASGDSEVEPCNLQVAVQQINFMTLPLTLAREVGFLEDQNVAVEYIVGEQTATMTAGLLSGDFELQVGGAEVMAGGTGGDILAVASLTNAPVWSIIATDDISSYEDIAGETIATSGPESVSTINMLESLSAAGVSPDDVNLITAGGTSARYAALEQGQVKVTLVASPFEFQAEKDGYSNLGAFAETFPDAVSGMLVASRSFAEEQTDCLVRFLKAWRLTHEWMFDESNADELVAIAGELIELDEDVTRQAYEYWLTGDMRDVQFAQDAHIRLPALETSRDLFLELGGAEELPAADDFVDHSYLDEAEAALQRDGLL